MKPSLPLCVDLLAMATGHAAKAADRWEFQRHTPQDAAAMPGWSSKAG